MTSRKSTQGAGLESTRIGRYPSSTKLTALLLGGLVALAALPPHWQRRPPRARSRRKEPIPCSKQRQSPSRTFRPLDKSQPARLETFTFGLG